MAGKIWPSADAAVCVHPWPGAERHAVRVSDHSYNDWVFRQPEQGGRRNSAAPDCRDGLNLRARDVDNVFDSGGCSLAHEGTVRCGHAESGSSGRASSTDAGPGPFDVRRLRIQASRVSQPVRYLKYAKHLGVCGGPDDGTDNGDRSSTLHRSGGTWTFVHVGNKGNPLYGFLLFFILSLGLGT